MSCRRSDPPEYCGGGVCPGSTVASQIHKSIRQANPARSPSSAVQWREHRRKMTSALVPSPRIDPRYAWFRLAIRESRIHRFGVYSLERIPARRKVIEYTGERISRAETKRRGHGTHTYLFTLDDYWTVDGASAGSGAG